MDGLHVPNRRRKSFLQRLRYGGTTHRNPKHIPVPRLKREPTTAIKRDNSFHVPATSDTGKNAASFSWAKMASAGTSDEDRLSTISSKEGGDEVKCKHVSFQRQDFGCQTDSELLKSILRMPYLRRRHSQRIQRSRAIDDGFPPALKFSSNGNNSVKVSYNRNMANGTPEPRPAPVESRKGKGKKGFLYPSYPDSPISTSDDFENEEDFEYYDSISDLLKAHPGPPICVNDASMSTYLNPLGNRNNDDSIDNDTEGSSAAHKPDEEKPTEEPHCQLVVENGTDGPNTLVVKEPVLNSLPHSKKSNQVGPNLSIKQSSSDHSLSNPIANSVCKGLSQASITSKRRASSPATPYISCNSVNTNAVVEPRRPSALSQVSFCSTKENSIVPLTTESGVKGSDDMTSDQFVDAVDKEEKSMLEFQTFLRKRGVELDMSYIESSDV